MYPNFRSLSHREEKRLELLRQAERDLKNDAVKRRAYKDAMWAADNEKNRINLSRSTTTSAAQTDGTSNSRSRASSNRTSREDVESDIGDPNESMSQFDENDDENEIGALSTSLSNLLSTEVIDETDEGQGSDSRDEADRFSYQTLVQLFNEYNLETYRFSPVRGDGSGRLYTTVVLGAEAKLINKVSGRPSRIDIDEVDWTATLEYIRQRIEQGNQSTLAITSKRRRRSKDLVEKDTKRAKSSIDGSSDDEFFDAREEPMNQSKSNEEAAKHFIGEIYRSYEWLMGEKIRPVMRNLGMKSVFSDKHYLGRDGLLHTISREQPSKEPEQSRQAKRINWSLTLEHLSTFLADYATISHVRQDPTRSREVSELIDLIDSFRARARLRGASVARRLRGRGLRGRGPINLRDIEGTGTASDQKYKRLGSKFIRLADLKGASPRLKLVFPNRTGVGPIRSISKPLAKLIDELVFSKQINEQLYNQLGVSDKQLFREVLKATHLQHQFSNSPGDPIENLKAEFDKLRGHLMLGNDNPEVIKELKAIAVDLYTQKQLSEDDFRKIIAL